MPPIGAWAARPAVAAERQRAHALPPGFPGPITGGEYEISMRYPRHRKMAALNSAISQLGLTWFRQIVDETLTTKANTWLYTPPLAQAWSNIYRVEIQINTAEEQIGYPFADAEYLNWRPRRWVDNAGIEVVGHRVWYPAAP